MIFKDSLIPGKLIKRYKRFLADVELENGETVTAHCANSGRMTECQGDDWPVLLSPQNKPARKLKFTWELVHNGTCWICVNTQHANAVATEAIQNGLIPELADYPICEREKKYGKSSRIDILLTKPEEQCFVEVKSVSLIHEGAYAFPDAPTERGRKHLDELIDMKSAGHRAVMLFMVMRSDANGFSPAAHIDAAYADKLAIARDKGVEVLVYGTDISSKEINVNKKIDCLF